MNPNLELWTPGQEICKTQRSLREDPELSEAINSEKCSAPWLAESSEPQTPHRRILTQINVWSKVNSHTSALFSAHILLKVVYKNNWESKAPEKWLTWCQKVEWHKATFYMPIYTVAHDYNIIMYYNSSHGLWHHLIKIVDNYYGFTISLRKINPLL